MFGKLGGGKGTPAKAEGEGGSRFGFGRPAASSPAPASAGDASTDQLHREIRNLKNEARHSFWGESGRKKCQLAINSRILSKCLTAPHLVFSAVFLQAYAGRSVPPV